MVDEGTSPEAPAVTMTEAQARAMLETVLAREKVIKLKWHDKTKDVYEIYEGSKDEETPFNILYSNTEILVPNLFSAAPKPVVRRRFGELRADEASRASERMAEYSMDTNLSGYPDFVDAIESVVLDAALPGQGQARIRVVENTACIDYVQATDFIWAYAKRWEDTPWLAYRSDKTHDDIVSMFKLDEEQAKDLAISKGDSSSANEDKGPDTAAVYEVWNKSTRMVYFLCDSYKLVALQVLEDPLQLAGFFPSGKPLRLLATPISTMPRAMYGLYKRQAEELNAITLRIKRVTQAIKIRGLYDGSMPEMENLFSGDNENKLTAAANPSGMMRDGGLDKHIWLVPVEKYVVVLNELFKAREQVKSTIYEILGIGDILRGVSAASETASAQQIKDKWGSLRIKKSREKVSAFVRQQIRFIIEVSAKHVPEETWAKVTGMNLMPSMQAMIMRQSMPPGSPPLPPSWAEVLQSLRDDLTRSYIIDIESNSTVDSDATEDKSDAVEFMTAFGQAMNGIAPLSEAGPEGFEAAKAILGQVCKNFRMGSEVLHLLDKIVYKDRGPTKEQQAKDQELVQKEQQVTQAEDQVKTSMEAVKSQFMQQKDQMGQLADSVQNQQQTLEKVKLEIQAKAQEMDAREDALKLREETLALAVREAELKIATAAQEVQQSQITNEVGQREKSVAFESSQVQAQAKQTAESGAEKTAVIDSVLAAVEAQSAIFKALLEKMNKPVRITKTGPGIYERQS